MTRLRDPRYAPDPALAAFLPEVASFLPVETVAEAKTPLAAPVSDRLIEIELASGYRMRISSSYDPAALARLIGEPDGEIPVPSN